MNAWVTIQAMTSPGNKPQPVQINTDAIVAYYENGSGLTILLAGYTLCTMEYSMRTFGALVEARPAPPAPTQSTQQQSGKRR